MRTVIVLIVAALLAAHAPVSAQSLSPLRASADSAFQAQDWARASALYASAAKLDTASGMTWFRLGVSSRNAGDLASAELGFSRAFRLRFQPAQAAFRLAQLAALRGQKDSSLALLRISTRLGTQVQLIEGEKDFAVLRGNAGYTRLIAEADSIRYPCRSLPQAHQFDFWIGDWDVSVWGQPAPPSAPKSFNSIQPLLQHCALLENWRALNGGEGKSFNWYDTNTGRWRQAWMGDGGGALDYTGEFRDGAMRFEGWTLNPNGTRTLQKLTFFPVHPDTVRQLFEASSDSGKTWQPTFDGRYVRRPRTP
ncbi:MAG: hypothetical protein ABJE47_08670 [bacterium]